jgi:hypothetical protein
MNIIPSITSILQVENLVTDVLPTRSILPFSSVANLIFRVTLVAHFLIRTTERFGLLEDKMTLAPGVLLNVTLGDRTWVKKSAQIVMIVKIVLRILDVQKRAISTYTKCANLWNNIYPIPVEYLKQKAEKEAEDVEQKSSFLSFIRHLPRSLFTLALRVQSTVQTVFEIGCEIFSNLTYNLLELYEACVFDRFTEFENITCIGANLTEIFNKLAPSQETCATLLQENSEMVDRLLHSIGSSYKTQDIVHFIERSLPIRKKAKQMLDEGKKTADIIVKTASFIVSGHTPSTGLDYTTTKQPQHAIRSFDDHDPHIDPSRKTRRWDPDARFYTTD